MISFFFFAGSIIWNTGFKEECLLYKKAFGLKKKLIMFPVRCDNFLSRLWDHPCLLISFINQMAVINF